MQELLTNAWAGWLRYTDNGKYAALLVIVLLFLWFRREEEKEKVLLIYTTLVSVMCVFPVSAAFLMAFQTRFYDYEWIWNYVPVTLLIAYGGTIFLVGCWEHYKKSVWKCVGITSAVVMLVVLCGNLGENVFDAQTESQERTEAQEILGLLLEDADGQEICLWAPKNIMASARAYDGSIQLIYGRNMWDAALGAYSYETYDEVTETLYLWMCNAEETGELEYVAESKNMVAGEESKEVTDTAENAIDFAWCLENAKAAGVNRILLPGSIEAENVKQQVDFAVEVTQLGTYHLLRIE